MAGRNAPNQSEARLENPKNMNLNWVEAFELICVRKYRNIIYMI